MTAHGRPGWYSWIVVVLVPIMASVGVLIVSLTVNQRSIARETAARVSTERAMCAMLELFTTGPPPVAGPAGDRGRAVLAAMRAYRATLRCD